LILEISALPSTRLSPQRQHACNHSWLMSRPRAIRLVPFLHADSSERNIRIVCALPGERERNMRVLTAYFAGAGTVVIAIVAGLGGGLVIADMIHPKSAKQGTEMTRLERHMSSEPVQTKPGPSEPVQYLATPQLSAPVATVAAAPTPAQPQTETGNSQSARAQPAQTAAAVQPAAPASQPATPAVQAVAPQQAAAANENAVAKARDAEVKRAVEKRKLERRQQWAERHRQRQQQELRAVEIREEIEPRQVFAAEPARNEMPLIRLFGPE
jgi:type IV secretory pathway VirB10-like protein